MLVPLRSNLKTSQRTVRLILGLQPQEILNSTYNRWDLVTPRNTDSDPTLPNLFIGVFFTTMKRVPPTTREKPSLDHLIRPHDTKTVIKQTDYDLNRILIQRPSNWSPHDQNSVHVPITSTPCIPTSAHTPIWRYKAPTTGMTQSIHRRMEVELRHASPAKTIPPVDYSVSLNLGT
ncbi:hypothetical protein F2Q69_00020778 [Brassica cretica]|uniref:Uncharacterized protein n=1 Tax=Brassica cretica TaxID=69181 RepID=A0A8S9QH36_BRACR|nr:hypothetical protein F2Q69_00020778 [Brassica cretica]